MDTFVRANELKTTNATTESPWDGEPSCSTCCRYVSLSPSSSAFLPVCKHTANCHIQLSTFFFSLHVWLHVRRSPSLCFSPLPLPSHLPSFIIWPPILVVCPLSSSHCPLSPAPSLFRPSPSVHLLPSSLHPSFLLSAGRRWVMPLAGRLKLPPLSFSKYIFYILLLPSLSLSLSHTSFCYVSPSVSLHLSALSLC